MRLRVLVAVAVLGLAGCADRDQPTGLASPPVAGAPSGGLDCGSHVLDQGQRPPIAALRCFLDAVAAGTPVTLAVTRPTIEGDPVPETYTADAAGAVTVVTDTRQDNYSSKIIYYRSCTRPSIQDGELTFARCTEPTPR